MATVRIELTNAGKFNLVIADFDGVERRVPVALSTTFTPIAAIATPTAPGAGYVQAEAAAMKTAVDAIRSALTAIGITL